MIYLYHHLGLGDHIICNGLVREIYKIEKEVSLYCKFNNLNNVTYMYRDLKNLHIIGIKSDQDILVDKNTLKIGFEYVYIFQQYGITWDESFYRQCNINFEKRWSSFFIEISMMSPLNNFVQFLLCSFITFNEFVELTTFLQPHL